MLFWTLFTACNPEAKSSDPVAETDPVAGSIRLCLPEDVQPSMETEEPGGLLTGNLLDIREGSGDCILGPRTRLSD